MLFNYKVKNSAGSFTTGKLEANDKAAALAALRAQKYFIVSLAEDSAKGQIQLSFFKPKIPLKDKIIFTKQLGMMVKAGLSIIDALKSLYEETENKVLKSIAGDLVSKVEGGRPLSEALDMHKDTFGEIYVNMVKSGEKSGKIDLVMERLSIQLEKDYELSRKVKGALSYPIFVLITMVGVLSLVVVLVIPQLKVIFDDAGVELPVMTRILIKLSMFLKGYGIFVLIGLLGLSFLFVLWQRTKNGKETIDKIIIKLPVLNILLKKSYMARFTRTFGTLVASGLPLIEVFEASGKVIGNSVYEKEIRAMSKKVEVGESLSLVFKKSPLFPKMVGQLAVVGEKSGNTDQVFDNMADFFEREVDGITGNLSTMLEPILMVVMGAGVGVVIMAVLQPIYSLVNAI